MSSSSRKPLTFSPPAQPAAYWPRDGVQVEPLAGAGPTQRIFCFSIRRLCASNETGSSIAISAISCSRWFWITSRAAPMPS